MITLIERVTLIDMCSAIVFIITVVAWVKPTQFRYLMDKGNAEPSLSRIGQFTALLLSSWAIVVTVMHDKLAEWGFGMYMAAWAGAQFGSIYMKVKNDSLKSSAPPADSPPPISPPPIKP
jgi:hypothetical protein